MEQKETGKQKYSFQGFTISVLVNLLRWEELKLKLQHTFLHLKRYVEYYVEYVGYDSC